MEIEQKTSREKGSIMDRKIRQRLKHKRDVSIYLKTFWQNPCTFILEAL